MDLNTLAPIVLIAFAAGGVAYVFLYPLLSGERRAEHRQKAFVARGEERRVDRTSLVNRRDQVAQSLKEIEAREKARNKVSLEMKIAQAGLGLTKGQFYAVSAGAALVTGLLVFLVTAAPLAALGGLFAGGFGLPQWFLSSRRKRRVKRFLTELPGALDVVVRGIRAGLPLNDCVRMIASEAQEPLRSEFRTVVEAQTLGLSLGEGLAKLHERVPVPETNFVAIVIGIQQQSGGNLSEAIGNLSKVLRERKKMRDKVTAMSMEAKASAGIIAAMPFTVGLLTYLSSPQYIELLWKTQVGQFAMMMAAVWMCIGVFVMKKMIDFDI
ncbi:type II secretion system F family protein [Salinarimonas soli]|uniref:Type II secretion system F family protein n=1 Tax=Salinarimonas soli TaxID=1638099 RepID=A0A5B2V9I2_9HYPH|nr:type II secretion system F family protein [Salinarimonas soli]KAA2234999.1 type II secretion system F family protein [Salinarimonas soli]